MAVKFQLNVSGYLFAVELKFDGHSHVSLACLFVPRQPFTTLIAGNGENFIALGKTVAKRGNAVPENCVTLSISLD